MLGPAAVSCLFAVLVYGYMNLDTKAALKYLQQVYQYNPNFSVLKVSSVGNSQTDRQVYQYHPNFSVLKVSSVGYWWTDGQTD